MKILKNTGEDHFRQEKLNICFRNLIGNLERKNIGGDQKREENRKAFAWIWPKMGLWATQNLEKILWTMLVPKWKNKFLQLWQHYSELK